MSNWHIITGELTPDLGGTADYSRETALGLRRDGHQVTVYCPAAQQTGERPADLKVQEISFDQSGFAQMRSLITDCPGAKNLLVHYIPQGFGALYNDELAPFLAAVKSPQVRIHLLVHEPFYPFLWLDKPTRWILSWIHRRQLAACAAHADRVLVSTSAFAGKVRQATGITGATWVPICAPFIPPEKTQQRRRQGDMLRVGSFGGFGHGIPLALRQCFTSVADDPRIEFVLLGKGAESCADQITSTAPALRGRISAYRDLTNEDISRHFGGLDVTVQPYDEGVTARRTSLMACLAHGVPTVTNFGYLSEDFWRQADGIVVVPELPLLGQAVTRLLDEPGERLQLGMAARQLYAARFSVEHAVSVLTSAAL